MLWNFIRRFRRFFVKLVSVTLKNKKIRGSKINESTALKFKRGSVFQKSTLLHQSADNWKVSFPEVTTKALYYPKNEMQITLMRAYISKFVWIGQTTYMLPHINAHMKKMFPVLTKVLFV